MVLLARLDPGPGPQILFLPQRRRHHHGVPIFCVRHGFSAGHLGRRGGKSSDVPVVHGPRIVGPWVVRGVGGFSGPDRRRGGVVSTCHGGHAKQSIGRGMGGVFFTMYLDTQQHQTNRLHHRALVGNDIVRGRVGVGILRRSTHPPRVSVGSLCGRYLWPVRVVDGEFRRDILPDHPQPLHDVDHCVQQCFGRGVGMCGRGVVGEGRGGG